MLDALLYALACVGVGILIVVGSVILVLLLVLGIKMIDHMIKTPLRRPERPAYLIMRRRDGSDGHHSNN